MLATGLADGSVWLFAQAKSRPPITTTTTPASSSSSPVRLRTPNPNPSTAAHRASVTGSTIFAGFNHNTNTSPTPGDASPTASSSAASVVSPAPWRPNAGAAKDKRTSTSLEALEDRLEAQYHAGEKKDSGLGQMMEALGLGNAGSKSSHSHHHHHHGSHSPSRTRADSKTSLNSSSIGSALMERTSSQASSSDADPPTPTHSRRRNHTRQSAVSLVSLGETSPVSSRPRSISQQEEIPATQSAPRNLDSLHPLLRLTSQVRSPVTGMARRGDLLVVLHASGSIIIWSAEDGRKLGEVDLTASEMYLQGQTAPTTAGPSVPPAAHAPSSAFTSSLASLAALRSHTNSPAVSGGSRVGTRPSTPVGKPAHPTAQAKPTTPSHHAHGNYTNLSVGEWSQDKVDIACYDSVKSRTVLIRAKSTQAHVIEFEVLGTASALDGPPSTNIPADALLTAKLSLDDVKPTVALVHHKLADGLPKLSERHLPLPTEHAYRGVALVTERSLVVWTDEALYLFSFERDEAPLSHQSTIELPQWQSVEHCPGSIVLQTDNGFHVIEVADTSLRVVSSERSGQSTAILRSEDGPSKVIIVQLDDEPGCMSIVFKQDSTEVKTLYSQDPAGKPAVQALLPLTMEKIIVATSKGFLQTTTLAKLAGGEVSDPPRANAPSCCSSSNPASLSMLQTIVHPRTQTRFVIGGYTSGDIAFWEASELHLLAEWSLFTTSIVRFHLFGNEDNTLRLNGCLAVVAEDSTVAIILLDGFKVLHLIPGRNVPLERLAVRADELLLLYTDERARVWDMASQELRRSIGVEQALSLLDDGAGAWSQFDCQSQQGQASTGVLSPVERQASVSTAGMTANLGRAIEAASKAAEKQKTRSNLPTSKATTQAIRPTARRAKEADTTGKAMGILKPLILLLWPAGEEADMDSKLSSELGLSKLAAGQSSLGMPQSKHSHVHCLDDDAASSGSTGALRTLSLLAMLSILAVDEALTDWVASRTSSSSSQTTLDDLAPYLVSSTKELRQAARRLFSRQQQQLRPDDIDHLTGLWRSALPGAASPPQSPASNAALQVPHRTALLLLGFLAIESYTSLDPGLLKDIAMAVTYSLISADAALQVAALELCLDGGFSIWQQYVDAMELLRRISTLAMLEGDEETVIVTAETLPLLAGRKTVARQATLQIAEEHTALFMTTLHLDILTASRPATALPGSRPTTSNSPSQANATMRLVAFIVHLKPLLLHPNLPRLAEAVVKSLDPTSPMRDLLLPSATLMIAELIETYPSISFHGKLQRLAVGTHEGAVLLYDLKTATRLFLLEGHRRKCDAVSLSAGDGRRLISVSLEEKRVLGWKVGNSLAGFFTPGVMPRQGGEDPSGAYKSRALRSAGRRSSASRQGVEEEEGLPMVTFNWKSDRRVLVEIVSTGEKIDFDVS